MREKALSGERIAHMNINVKKLRDDAHEFFVLAFC